MPLYGRKDSANAPGSVTTRTYIQNARPQLNTALHQRAHRAASRVSVPNGYPIGHYGRSMSEFEAPRRTRRSSPETGKDARSVQRSAQTRVRTSPSVRADFQAACQEAGISVQDALELVMTRAEAFGWLDVLARLQHRQTELDLDGTGEGLAAAG